MVLGSKQHREGPALAGNPKFTPPRCIHSLRIPNSVHKPPSTLPTIAPRNRPITSPNTHPQDAQTPPERCNPCASLLHSPRPPMTTLKAPKPNNPPSSGTHEHNREFSVPSKKLRGGGKTPLVSYFSISACKSDFRAHNPAQRIPAFHSKSV